MDELRNKIKNFAFKYSEDKYETVYLNSQLIDNANIRFSDTDDVRVILNIDDAILDDLDADKSYLSPKNGDSNDVVDVFGRNSKAYKYIFTLFRTITDFNKSKISKYIEEESIVRSYYVRDVVEIRFDINPEIIE